MTHIYFFIEKNIKGSELLKACIFALGKGYT